MELVIVLIVPGVLVLLGFVLGQRFAEVNLRMRERRLAEQRRELAERSRRTTSV